MTATDSPTRRDRYRRILAVPGMRRTMLLAYLVKLPVIAIPIVLTLQVSVGIGRGLGSAGLVIAGWLVGATVGSPFIGRAVDRWGLRPVVLLSAVAQGVFWSVAALLPYPVLVAAAVLDGLVLVPGSTIVRLVVARAPEPYRPTGFALDTLSTQLSYLMGPALAAVLATQVSPAVATRTLGAVLTAGSLAAALTTPPLAAAVARGGERGQGRPGGRLLAVLACTVAAGIVASGFEISIVAVLRAHDALGWTGLLLAACGAYAAAGSLFAGATTRPAPAWAATALLGAVTVPLGLVGDWPLLLLGVGPAAMLSATAFTASATAASAAAPPGARGQTLGLYGAALAAGNSAGAPLAGLASSVAGPGWGFAAVGAAALAIGLAAWLPLRHRPAATAMTASEGMT
jgi:predicted MFS family arabinose efflux permease